ncbi:MAG: hypothetical protein GY941_04375 [Planctomycetes bacterium]|nr:hypothetical protein [Planctomycetota bacterium]
MSALRWNVAKEQALIWGYSRDHAYPKVIPTVLNSKIYEFWSEVLSTNFGQESTYQWEWPSWTQGPFTLSVAVAPQSFFLSSKRANIHNRMRGSGSSSGKIVACNEWPGSAYAHHGENICVDLKIKVTEETAILNLKRVRLRYSSFSPQVGRIQRTMHTMDFLNRREGQITVQYCPVAVLQNHTHSTIRCIFECLLIDYQYGPLTSLEEHATYLARYNAISCHILPAQIQQLERKTHEMCIQQTEYISDMFGGGKAIWWGCWRPAMLQQKCLIFWSHWPKDIYQATLQYRLEFKRVYISSEETTTEYKTLRVSRLGVATVLDVPLCMAQIRLAKRLEIKFIVRVKAIHDEYGRRISNAQLLMDNTRPLQHAAQLTQTMFTSVEQADEPQPISFN